MLIAVKFWPKSSSFDSQKLGSTASALVDSTSSQLRIASGRTRVEHVGFSMSVYDGFAWHFLTASAITSAIDLDFLSRRLDCRLLTAAIEARLPRLSKTSSREEVLWLLAHYIHLSRRSYREESDSSYVGVISNLISYCAPDIESRMQSSGTFTSSDENPLPQYVEQQLLVGLFGVRSPLFVMSFSYYCRDGYGRSPERVNADTKFTTVFSQSRECAPTS